MWLVIGLEVEVEVHKEPGNWIHLPKNYYPLWITALKDKNFYPMMIKFRLRENW